MTDSQCSSISQQELVAKFQNDAAREIARSSILCQACEISKMEITAIIQDLDVAEIVAAASCWFCQSRVVISKTINDQNLTIEHFASIQ